MHCPLCGSATPDHFHRDLRRDYYRCRRCRLVFVPSGQRLDAEREKAEYDLHRNDPDDQGYRHFLGKLVEPLRQRLPAGTRGLDFGCGPGPALARMFEETGHPMAIYDPFYADDPTVFEKRYDFITCTEVVEHLFRPDKVFQKLFSVLRPEGWLGIMTKRVIDRNAFARWHYKNDPTHVCFFSEETFRWIAAHHACSLQFIGSDVVLLQKSA